MEPSKKEIRTIQGISVLAMLCLHLFCRYDYERLYEPLIFVFGYPVSFYLGQLSDFCVMGFAFCSGYAHYNLYHSDKKYMKNRLKSLTRLIVNYWIVLMLFTIISMFAGNGNQIPGSLKEFLGNFFVVKMSYNGAWWYLLTYIFIVLTSVPIIKLTEKYSMVMSVVLLGIYTISYIVRFRYPSENWLVQQSYLYGMTVFEYFIGILFNRYAIFTKLKNVWNNIRSNVKYVGVAMVFFAMLLGHTLVSQSAFLAPFIGLVLIVLYHLVYKECKLVTMLEMIGKHSTNMWLTLVLCQEKVQVKNDFFQ